ncbi:MAG TPA: rod shape-determining protein MreD [Bacteroidales bacterium]|nr:rod shape-determining protein MreD [Bacteroidales bacterium]HRZ77209.1 rod shape-determining protein MreD [Bacteroidales bacterium]
MNNLIVRNVLRFFVLLVLQVFVLDNVHLGGYINPYLYVLFVLLLPFETPGWLVLTSSFLLGIGVDIFSGTGGIHAAALTLMAFMRPLTLTFIASRREYEPGINPTIADLGLQWFVSYAGFLILVHHLSLFMLEMFSFSGFFDTLKRAFLSSLVTFTLILIIQYLFYPVRSSRI